MNGPTERGTFLYAKYSQNSILLLVIRKQGEGRHLYTDTKTVLYLLKLLLVRSTILADSFGYIIDKRKDMTNCIGTTTLLYSIWR